MPFLVCTYIYTCREGRAPIPYNSKILPPLFKIFFMDSRFKLGISRIFRASFNSCRSKHISDDAQEPVFIHHPFHLLQPTTPLDRSHSSVRRLDDTDGGSRPPASPISPLNSHIKFQEFRNKEEGKVMKTKKKKVKGREAVDMALSSTSSTDTHGIFSTDDEREEETETLVSSKSFSSDSSELHCFRRGCLRRSRKSHRRKIHIRNSNLGFQPLDYIPPNAMMEGKVRESVAVVKRSNDPYGDFRRSMVEMIIEKQMFTANDLEQLLRCFLSLNSAHHHQVIVEAFSEIWVALYTNWP
ncbi:transcription repressor OFP8 [Magnolia sinica]|uniref:transcription repressor OFP8 n=1 Tax=Magnolia sinica TaxID=86752 RepID=UPI00265B58D4|nr:transcription repressor OFP8 [Magnolia sinica]